MRLRNIEWARARQHSPVSTHPAGDMRDDAFWAAAPKVTISCRSQREICVHPSICPFVHSIFIQLTNPWGSPANHPGMEGRTNGWKDEQIDGWTFAQILSVFYRTLLSSTPLSHFHQNYYCEVDWQGKGTAARWPSFACGRLVCKGRNVNRLDYHDVYRETESTVHSFHFEPVRVPTALVLFIFLANSSGIILFHFIIP